MGPTPFRPEFRLAPSSAPGLAPRIVLRRVAGRPFALSMALVVACGESNIEYEGLLGEPIALLSGDGSPLPRLAFIDEGCPGQLARGGCDAVGPRRCRPLLVDSLAPLTTLKGEGLERPAYARECLEVRSAADLGTIPPVAEAQDAAVARFRFHDLPLVRAPAPSPGAWSWQGGPGPFIEVDGVLGGNLLHQFAVALRSPAEGQSEIALYTEFPGTDEDLADQGRAFLAVQFPGRLLGRDLGDRCDIGGSSCRTPGFDIIRGQPNYALAASRMVLDACMAPPPCAVRYRPAEAPSSGIGVCGETLGPLLEDACVSALDAARGGRGASLVLATSVPNVVLFEDSATRILGDLDALPPCSPAPVGALACMVARDGQLAVPGWPPAGATDPLRRIRIRSLALVPGLTRTRGPSPCERLQARRDALLRQCERYLGAAAAAGDRRNTTPPYSARDDDNDGDPSDASMAVLGEVWLTDNDPRPNPDVWLETLILPATHPLPVALRLDVVPEAIQPDGLLGTALLRDTIAVLDYTDPNPGVRLSCLEPEVGTCQVAPDCRDDAQPACCYGLPLNLLADFITGAEDDTCCAALSATTLAEVQAQGLCPGVQPP